MYDAVQYSLADGVATVLLNRPEQLNALNEQLKNDLREALRAVAEDEQVRAVVLTGAGRAFCVGQDLVEHSHNLESGDGPASVAATVAQHYAPIAATIATMPKPVIAAVNGVAAGAGAAFAFACDFRILGEAARFSMAFASIGLAVDSGLSWSLPRLVGVARAKELLLMPTTIDAARALELGLATRVVDPEQVLSTAVELAQTLAAGPTIAFGAIRRAVNYAASHDLDESLAFEAQLMAQTAGTFDHQAAVRAFLAKEQPAFEGR